MTDLKNPRVVQAGKWLAMCPEHEKPNPIIPALRQHFGLTMLEATEAVAEANLIRARAH